MRILFWNVQRLGWTSDDNRRSIIGNVFYSQAPDIMLLCELTTASQTPQAQNITYRLQNSSQLCYGATNNDGSLIQLTRINPPVGAGYPGRPGGNNFANLVDRALAYAGIHNNYHIYVFHAPAYFIGAERAATFLTYALNALHAGQNWLVIGDHNVEPYKLTPFVQNHAFQPNTATYIGGMPKMYDYVLTNNPANFSLQTIVPGGAGSDHLPIVLDF
ncbi:endonuclease/exonuclease/phosphatase family protein [Chryseobacterium sp. c4a]|uniref:endonuclease/exonuclease/phosphatase family protein n=1 Tax=Chryseobacterium sp. c4a TaxID=1573582 RepID=UPI001357D830|nr:endonuclease/exonuclease/phosphatase family protein [Chryseobacterium sp. c4a]